MNEMAINQPVRQPAPDSLDSLRKARELMEKGAFAAAQHLLKEVLEQDPHQVEARYMRAVCFRYRGKVRRSLRELDSLQDIAPHYARAYQEAGHGYRSVGEDEHALRAYRHAVTLNPGLIASWKALSELEASHGSPEAAERARLHHERLAGLPRELVSVTSMIHEGKLYKAERLCRHFLQNNRHHVEGMRLLALLGSKLHVLDDAEFLLESCLEFEPDNIFARFDYVNVLHKRQKFAKALEQARILREGQPGNPSFETAYANECMAVGNFDEALQTYDTVLKAMPGNPNIHLARGHALKTVGRTDDAVEAYRTAYRSKPEFGDAYWSLANLKTYRFSDEEIQQMGAQQKLKTTSLEDRYHLAFALGKAFEDRKDYEQSFYYYDLGNSLKKGEVNYSADRTTADFRRQMEVCTPELFEAKRDMGHPAPDPIFIVGLPRSGSTLIEQILASHSQVDGTMELPNILATAHRLNGRRRVYEEPRYPGILPELTAEQLEQLGQRYIEDTKIHRAGAPFFIDKMPNNFRHIGLIHLILPNARIIDARRHPMACCFSGYKQLFAEGQEFTYSLEDVGRYYRDYVALMDHWDEVLPDRVLRVRYEDVVADLETQVRRLLDFLGLPFEQACLDFHKTERSVRTASSEQVRQPLYKSGVEQWRHYEPWLGPLKETLGEDLLQHA